ncbi:las17-binding protein actin regulator domain-containing protein [Trichoderma breve]|uniref:Las17-binding protein actin regulator domain-containing protein n=1 Tax=Trichoderma breve TaxID=2034170 RepID=A0A9W9JS35_9HYPO|nr:las17-binding protein actin regulator domain-containing protein [Trichoderma breve]KAJ4865006.1 las17-binding protein actin regulator domain-containing protein [Trichoderma breve]
MQRVSAFLPSWEKRNSGGSRSGSVFGWPNRSSQPPPPNGLSKINTDAANMQVKRVQREAFWPATLDLESDKAARILKSFCVDGYFAPIDDVPVSPSSTSTGVRTLDQVPKKIPKRIIQNAAAIAVFTCMRSGLWMTGSGGSGILIARKSDGTWSPPSGIMLHTPTLSFIIGVDVYDCVLVITSLSALESVSRPRVTLGEDVELRTGETVSIGSDEADVNWRDLGNTVLTYMKARGQQQSVNLYGCMLSERSNENDRFYGSTDITHMDILAGNVARGVEETTSLNEVLKMAEGRTDYDNAVITRVSAEPAPSDALITTSPPKSADDPDPFGVLALEMAGLEIREAGSRIRPTSSLFDMNQAPMSPTVASKFSRQSMDTFVTDAGTQTDVGNTPATSPSPGPSDSNGRASPAYIESVKEEEEEDDEAERARKEEEDDEDEDEDEEEEEEPVLAKAVAHRLSKDVSAGVDSADEAELSDDDAISLSESLRREEDEMSHDESSEEEGLYEHEEDDSDDDMHDANEDDDIEEEEPVVFEVAAVQRTSTQALSSRMIQARGNVVTIAKRVPPPLPTRSPARMSHIANKDATGEELNLQSPLSQTFSSDGDMDGQEADADKIDAVAATEQTEQEAEHSESDESDAAEEPQHKAPASEGNVPSSDESSADESDLEERKQDDVLLNEPHNEQIDNSDAASSKKKHTSSIYTGVTEDRWSDNGSSVTTPTSEQRFSLMMEEKIVDETPKKTIQEAKEVDDSPSAPTETAHSPAVTVAN